MKIYGVSADKVLYEDQKVLTSWQKATLWKANMMVVLLNTNVTNLAGVVNVLWPIKNGRKISNSTIATLSC